MILQYPPHLLNTYPVQTSVLTPFTESSKSPYKEILFLSLQVRRLRLRKPLASGRSQTWAWRSVSKAHTHRLCRQCGVIRETRWGNFWVILTAASPCAPQLPFKSCLKLKIRMKWFKLDLPANETWYLPGLEVARTMREYFGDGTECKKPHIEWVHFTQGETQRRS